MQGPPTTSIASFNLNPSDVEQWKHLAETYDQSAQSETRKSRAIQHYATALGLAEQPLPKGLNRASIDRMALPPCRVARRTRTNWIRVDTSPRTTRSAKWPSPNRNGPQILPINPCPSRCRGKNYAAAWRLLTVARYEQVRRGLAVETASQAATEPPAKTERKYRRSGTRCGSSVAGSDVRAGSCC